MKTRRNRVNMFIDLLDQTLSAVDEVKTVYNQLKSIAQQADTSQSTQVHSRYSVDPKQRSTIDSSSYTVNGHDQSKEWVTEVRLAGVSYGNRQEIIAKLHRDERINLQREPNNRYDANAIGIQISSTKQHIGWIPRDIAQSLALIMDRGIGCRATIQSISGGQKGSYMGVNINILTPVPLFEKLTKKRKAACSEKKEQKKGQPNRPESAPWKQAGVDQTQTVPNVRGYACDDIDSDDMYHDENDELFSNYIRDPEEKF